MKTKDRIMTIRQKIEREYVNSYKEYCERVKITKYKPIKFRDWVKFYSMRCLKNNKLKQEGD